mmetsp:Transcript_11488/g.14977  ORF Transcript_11488/g.14977 Transcript_11488/m.14977 type:complete len:226 (+) Transcript_11488:156-833(+)
MNKCTFFILLAALIVSVSQAFVQNSHKSCATLSSSISAPQVHTRRIRTFLASTVEETVAEETVKMESDVGMDYVPLAGMLMSGEWEEADQFTRDALIKIAGPQAQKQGFVYWTQVKYIPSKDLATIERLWLKYSEGKFGYSVQKKIWQRQKGLFDPFCEKIGWKIDDNGTIRLRKWFGKSEFIYDLEKAPRGHFPLTSALRGVTLLKEILNHPVWEEEEFAPKKK